MIAAALGSPGPADALTSEWLIEEKTLSEYKPAEETTSFSAGATIVAIPGKNAKIECSATEGTGKVFSGGTDELTVSLKKCAVYSLSGELLKACTVEEPLTIKAKTELFQTGENLYYKFLPLGEKIFGTVLLKGGLCALPSKMALTGAFAAEFSTESQSEQPLHPSEAITKKVNESLAKEKAASLDLLAGASTAYITSELLGKLSGSHAGAKWARLRPLTRLCSVEVVTCGGMQIYQTGTKLKAESETASKFTFLGIEPECSSRMEGATLSEGGIRVSGGFATVTFEECSGKCTVTAENTPFVASFWATASGNGKMSLFGTGGQLEFKIECGMVTCRYEVAVVVFNVNKGAPARFSKPNKVLLAETGGVAGCPMAIDWEGGVATGGFINYKFVEPGSLFLTG